MIDETLLASKLRITKNLPLKIEGDRNKINTHLSYKRKLIHRDRRNKGNKFKEIR